MCSMSMCTAENVLWSPGYSTIFRNYEDESRSVTWIFKFSPFYLGVSCFFSFLRQVSLLHVALLIRR